MAKGMKIDMTTVESSISPEILFNISNEERLEEFKKLMAHFNDELKQLKNIIAIISNQDPQVSKECKAKYQTLVRKADALKKLAVNPWLLPPKYHLKDEVVQTVSVRKDIPSNKLLIVYTPDPGLPRNAEYIMTLQIINEKNKTSLTIDGLKKRTSKISYPKGTANISECTVLVLLKKRHVCCLFPVNTLVAEYGAKLAKLHEENEMRMVIDSNDKKFSFEISLCIKSPADGSTTRELKRSTVVIDRIIPPFRTQRPRSQTVVADSTRPVPPRRAAPELIPNNKTPPAEQNSAMKELLEGISKEDVRDPDNASNLISVSYLTEKIAECKKEIQQKMNRGENSNDLSEKLFLMTKNKVAIQNEIKKGTITLENYKKALVNQLEKDKRLSLVFEKTKKQNEKSVVDARINCLKKEIASFK
eukprot:TRINITY_DN7053_c0_g2_i2.p1 TRINITY_DN7053_c0_g2~~TRINITY_DN7053_c0_g2_i2.p1  ORF type:complete len:418 (-),score=96.90 TRINITY_DN7053_c0_g2_i2:50-1303(-)